jgi:hypothetical protein
MIELIILNDGLYQLVPVNQEMLKGIELLSEASCFDWCDILRLKLSGYAESINLHVMNDGSGYLFGCMCR